MIRTARLRLLSWDEHHREAFAAPTYARQTRGLRGLLCYTVPGNLRSQSVIRKLGLDRAPELDCFDPDAGEQLCMARAGGRLVTAGRHLAAHAARAAFHGASTSVAGAPSGSTVSPGRTMENATGARVTFSSAPSSRTRVK